MPIDALLKLVPPPKEPTAATGDWKAIEADLERKLPEDWKELVSHYGYGTFGGFLVVFSPFFAPCPMASQARGMLDADRELQKAVPTAVPFTLYPEKDGALPWAQSENGQSVYWLTWGEDPAAWPVGVFNPRGGKLELFEGGAVELLRGWLSGDTKLPGFPTPGTEEQGPAVFDRWIERAHATLQLRGGEGRSYEERLKTLLDGLGPSVERRGQYGDEEDEKRQVHFATEGGDCRFTYDTVYGHNIRISAPPARLEAVTERVRSLLPAMGLRA